MKTKLTAVAFLLSILSLSPLHAAATGNAWGVQSGNVSCATFNPGTTPEHRCYLVLIYPGSPPTVITCIPPFDLWCAAIASGKTVLLSFDDRSVIYNNGGTIQTEKVPNGSLLSVY